MKKLFLLAALFVAAAFSSCSKHNDVETPVVPDPIVVPEPQPLAIAFTEGNSLQFDAGETKTVHYTITGGNDNNVVKVEMQNLDGAYALSTTQTSAAEGTITITAKTPTDNRVIVSVSDGSQTIMAAIDVSVILRASFDGKTIMVETPGTLAKLLADYDKTTITELTVIGNLNDKDIWTLGDLPNLAVLAMEHVNLEELPYGAFYNNSSLTSIKLPLTLKTIGDSAFERCSSLTSITIPDSVTSIGSAAFVDCNSLTGVYITDIAKWCAIEFKSNPLIYAHNLYLNGELVTELVIPDSVTTIGDSAFYGCHSLTSVTIGNGVTSIGVWAFSYCSGLTSVTIGNSVTSIGFNAFRYCSSLASITIPDSVTTIELYAFENCTSLTSVTIPDSVTEIGNGIFYQCSNLTNVTMPKSTTEIKAHTFAECNLTDFPITENITKIGPQAFYKCPGPESVTIPAGATEIGEEAFVGCKNLKEVYCKATVPPSCTKRAGSTANVLLICNYYGVKLYVPVGTAEAYKAAEGWKYFSNIVEMEF